MLTWHTASHAYLISRGADYMTFSPHNVLRSPGVSLIISYWSSFVWNYIGPSDLLGPCYLYRRIIELSRVLSERENVVFPFVTARWKCKSIYSRSQYEHRHLSAPTRKGIKRNPFPLRQFIVVPLSFLWIVSMDISSFSRVFTTENIIGAIVILFVLFTYRSLAFSWKNIPPGPRPLPLVGNVLQIPTDNQEGVFTEWGARYGQFILRIWYLRFWTECF